MKTHTLNAYEDFPLSLRHRRISISKHSPNAFCIINSFIYRDGKAILGSIEEISDFQLSTLSPCALAVWWLSFVVATQNLGYFHLWRCHITRIRMHVPGLWHCVGCDMHSLNDPFVPLLLLLLLFLFIFMSNVVLGCDSSNRSEQTSR